MNTQLNEFKAIINNIAFINPAEWEYLETSLYVAEFSKDYVLHKEGDVIDCFYFILSGSIRKFSQNDGVQVTHNLYSSKRFVSDLLSISENIPSIFTLEALSDTVVVVLKIDFANKLFSMSPTYEKIARVLYQQAFIEESARLREVLIKEPFERLIRFSERHKDLYQTLPSNKIAACLNIAPETLSRLRKRMLENS